MDINANTYSDYLMILSPPSNVVDTLGKYKKATANTIGNYVGMKGTAHITVTHQYRQMTAMMKQKLDCYKKPLDHLKPITLHVNGFNFFKHGESSATVYAKIELNNEVTRWFGEIKKIMGDKQKNMVPHITIAKNIPIEKFRMVWPKFIDKQYCESFTPQGITVLSRPMIGGNQQPWTVFKELYFNNFE